MKSFSAIGRNACVLMSIALVVAGCSKSTQDKLLGTWKPEVGMAMMQLTFNSDGTCTFGAENGKYRVDGDKLVISTMEINSGKPTDETMQISSLDDKKLVLKMPDGEETFIKVQ